MGKKIKILFTQPLQNSIKTYPNPFLAPRPSAFQKPLYYVTFLELCNDRRGEQISILNLDQTRLNMQFIFPLNEIATGIQTIVSFIHSFFHSFLSFIHSSFQPFIFSFIIPLTVLFIYLFIHSFFFIE